MRPLLLFNSFRISEVMLYPLAVLGRSVRLFNVGYDFSRQSGKSVVFYISCGLSENTGKFFQLYFRRVHADSRSRLTLFARKYNFKIFRIYILHSEGKTRIGIET